MKAIMKIFYMIITMLIIVGAFVCGYLLGADNTEQKYTDEAMTKVDWTGDPRVIKLKTEVDDLNHKVVMLNSENDELRRLLQQEKDKGVIGKMSDNLSNAWNRVVVVWNVIVD
jgi:peptidoglycan hydrolase CwlO-like protein